MSRRQRARARRTEPFWRAKLARVADPPGRANVAYDQARAEVADLPPEHHAEGWETLAEAVEELHDRLADRHARRTWDRLVGALTTPRERAWSGWRRLWSVVDHLPAGERDAAWQAIEERMVQMIVTLRAIRTRPNSGEAQTRTGGSTGSRGPADPRGRTRRA